MYVKFLKIEFCKIYTKSNFIIQFFRTNDLDSDIYSVTLFINVTFPTSQSTLILYFNV